jgi:hypothetical protein
MTGNVFAQAIDRGPWMLYDTQTDTQGTAWNTSYPFFGNTAGGGARGKTTTNLVQANRVPPPYAFHAHSVGFYFGPSTLMADIISLLEHYHFEFKIGEKTFAEGLLQFWPAGAGVTGWASTNSATVAVIQSIVNGQPSVQATRRFPEYPRTIPQNVYFGLEVKSSSISGNLTAQVASTAVSPVYGGLTLVAVLDGVYDRAVQ